MRETAETLKYVFSPHVPFQLCLHACVTFSFKSSVSYFTSFRGSETLGWCVTDEQEAMLIFIRDAWVLLFFHARLKELKIQAAAAGGVLRQCPNDQARNKPRQLYSAHQSVEVLIQVPAVTQLLFMVLVCNVATLVVTSQVAQQHSRGCSERRNESCLRALRRLNGSRRSLPPLFFFYTTNVVVFSHLKLEST